MVQPLSSHGLTLRRLLVGFLVALVIFAGMKLRSWTWEETTHLRFQHDIVNGFYWGRETLIEARRQSPDDASAAMWGGFFRGYIALYDRVRAEAYEKNYLLDYPPLRLLVMSLWTRHVRQEFPGLEDGTPDYVEPLLRLNVVCEALSAGAIFLLVRLWVRRAGGTTDSRWVRQVPQEHRASLCGLAAAASAWLNPSLILDAHGWPQWDVWILPFYLFAALAASKNRWFWCGCLLAGGAMLKGQLLLVAPFFVFWPLAQKRWRRAVDLLAGFIATIALIVSPWMLRTPQAWVVLAATGLVAGGWLLRKRSRRSRGWFVGILGLATLAAGIFCGGTFAWLQIGLLYGSERYPYLFISSCYNLPSLLADLGWGLKKALFEIPLGGFHLSVTPQWTLRVLYIVALAFCAVGAARHARKRDPRVLIAIAAPWLVMFALLGQMHERYLVWGGVVSAVAFGVSVRLALLHWLISAASMAMILHVMLLDKKLEATLGMIALMDRIRPAASWIILATIAVWFWETVSRKIPAFRGRRQVPGAAALG